MIIRQFSMRRDSFAASWRSLSHVLGRGREAAGFTLIETLVAIMLLTVAIVAPMSLTVQSLNSAYFARDQITASYLAQEAIEDVRAQRDHNILEVSVGTPPPNGLLDGLPSTTGAPFMVDTRNNSMQLCPSGVCPFLQTDGTFYGYNAGWTNTYFRRTITATAITPDEIQVNVVVSWQSSTFQSRSITMTENLYLWVNAGSGAS